MAVVIMKKYQIKTMGIWKNPTSFEMFLAKRIIKPAQGSFSGPIILISIISLVLGLSVMIIALLVLTGFKKEISEKLSGFTGHIHIVKYNSNNSLELPPIYMDSVDIQRIASIKGVHNAQVFISKAAIIRTDNDMQGVMVKGVGADFDSTFFSNNLINGRLPRLYGINKTDEVLISEKMANLLDLELNDLLRIYFVNNETGQLRGRRLEIIGMYRTSVEEFDERFVLADIRHLQKLNNWNQNEVSGIELFVEDFSQLESIERLVNDEIPYDLSTENVKNRYPQIFDWLQLQDINVIVILVLIILVATVSMISTLLVLILERTQMIGVLKAMGARNSLIRRVFLIQAAYIIIIGLFFGNLLGIGLAYLQKTYGFIQLDAETYYMSVVPIHMDMFPILILNMATLTLVLLFMVLPVMVTSKIEPAESMRFD